MLSRRYQHKLLKKINSDLKWANRLRYRDKILKVLKNISLIPFKIRIGLSNDPLKESHHWGKLGGYYINFAYFMTSKSETAHADYLDLLHLENSISYKFARRMFKEAKNIHRNGVNDNE